MMTSAGRMKMVAGIVLAAGVVLVIAMLPRTAARREPPSATLMGVCVQVAKSAVVWANSHNDRFPPNLATLVENGLIKPQSLVVAGREHPALPETRPDDPAVLARDLAAFSDVVYTGADLSLPLDEDMWPPPGFEQIIVAYGRAVPGDPLRALAFADGHGVRASGDALDRLVRISNKEREKLGLKAFELDGPVPAARAAGSSSKPSGATTAPH